MVSGANTAVVVRVVSSTDLDSGPADAALVRLMEAGWAGMDADPFLLHLATPPVSAEQDRDRHAPILERLQAVIERGRREGDIAPDLGTGWILAAVLALGHAAGEEVRAGRMTSAAAIATLRLSIPRLVRPAPPS